MPAFPLWAAIRTVKDKIGTWKGYERTRELYPSITREEWATAVSDARAAIAARIEEITKPLNRRPVGDEVKRFDTRAARGYLQQVEVYVRDRETGLIETRHHSLKVETLRSRLSAVSEVTRRFKEAAEQNPEDYPEDVIGVAYVGTYLMVPRE